MKTKFVFIQILVVAALSIHGFAGSPDKNNGDKTNFSSLPSPPSPWTLTIDVTDPCDTCTAYPYCNLSFMLEAATANCKVLMFKT